MICIDFPGSSDGMTAVVTIERRRHQAQQQQEKKARKEKENSKYNRVSRHVTFGTK